MNITYRLSETDLIFNWKEPSEDKKNGVIIKYRYKLYEGKSSTGTMMRDALTTNRRMIFQEWEANKFYTLRIRAYTIKGDGPWSNDFIVLTTPPSSTQSPALPTRSGEIGLPLTPETVITDTQKNTNSSLQDRLGIIVAAVIVCIIFAVIIIGLMLWTLNMRKSRRNNDDLPRITLQQLLRERMLSNETVVAQRSPGIVTPGMFTFSSTGSPPLSPGPMSPTCKSPLPILSPQAEYYKIPWENMILENFLIAEGNFGQVMKGVVKKEGAAIQAAVKMLKEGATDNDRRDFFGELMIMAKVGYHPNIVNLIGASEYQGILYVATEFAEYGNLLNYLRRSRCLETDPTYANKTNLASTLSSENLLQIAADVSLGMKHLSEKGCVHRDLAARNILLCNADCGQIVAKVTDFGLSRSEEVYVKTTAVSYIY
ncbi:tyrosine-protein kinase receptor Tie-1-like [Anneissia japonica]|uniref:tyrosine-protein kinase receptor Tie-1-like n=1 Tax=Anneissia japonica TaxID=1529436 RepID=UPI0014256537|nr:tyrosine-protein kinase receptor Tie-1-like [Anneissia japonica]